MLLIAILILSAQSLSAIMDRATEDFRAGRVEDALKGFDRAALLAPNEAPFLWQRGIAQFYNGRFRDCARMFATHRTVNPDDVENAAWHFICVAQADSFEAARRQLLPVGTDPRAPMREIYAMFQGRATPAQVLKAAGTDIRAQFYARLYNGLYLEATGDHQAGRAQIEIAAEPRFAAAGGYMHDVARIHLQHR